VPRDQLVHQAAEVGRQVLDDHERHAGIGGHLREQLLERFEAARGGADADDPGRGDIRRHRSRHGCRWCWSDRCIELLHWKGLFCANRANGLSS
jgi:hypothetical protein